MKGKLVEHNNTEVVQLRERMANRFGYAKAANFGIDGKFFQTIIYVLGLFDSSKNLWANKGRTCETRKEGVISWEEYANYIFSKKTSILQGRNLVYITFHINSVIQSLRQRTGRNSGIILNSNRNKQNNPPERRTRRDKRSGCSKKEGATGEVGLRPHETRTTPGTHNEDLFVPCHFHSGSVRFWLSVSVRNGMQGSRPACTIITGWA